MEGLFKHTAVYVLMVVTQLSCGAPSNDTIQLSQVTVNSISFEQTTTSIVSILGNPESVTNYNNEIDNENWLDYKYSGNSFYFFNNQEVSFDLRTDLFYFYNPSIKVGNNIEEINNFFPNSYSKREISKSLGFIIININMPDGTVSDTFIIINYDSGTNIISSIHMGSD